MALCAGALGKELDPDDLAHARVIQRGLAEGSLRPLWELYVHIPHNPAGVFLARHEGNLPWWTWEGVHIAFLRPLAALTQCLDYIIWPSSPALMYGQNVLWYGLLCGLVTLLMRRLLRSDRAALLAALIFVVDDAHAQNVGWIANRSSLLAAVFGVLCLLAYVRWRQDGWRAGAALAPACLGLSLACGEIGISSFGLLACFTLCLDRGPVVRRLLALGPSMVVVVAWAAVYHGLGFGAYGSGAYISPTGDPLGYLLALPYRGVELLLLQVAASPLALSALPGVAAVILSVVALLASGLLLMGYSLPRLRCDREIRFMVLALIVCLLPVISSVTHPRLLLFSSIPAAALAARLLLWLVQARRLRFLAAPAAGIVALTHLVAAPIGLARGAGPPGVPLSAFARLHEDALDAVQDLGRKQLVVVNSPDILHGFLVPAQRQALGLPAPAVSYVWCTTINTVDLTRVDHRTLDLTSDHWFAGDPFAVNFRNHAHPLRRGQELVLRSHVVQVAELLPFGRPRRVRFRFPQDLDTLESLVLLSWDGRRYVRIGPPPLGRTVRLGGGR